MRLLAAATAVFLLILTSVSSRGANSVPLFKEQFQNAGSIYQTLPLADGQLLVTGDFQSINGVLQGVVARVDRDGKVDQSWRPQVGSNFFNPYVAGDAVYFSEYVEDVRPSGVIVEYEQIRRISLTGDGSVDEKWRVRIPIPAGEDQQEDTVGVQVQGGFVYVLRYGYDGATGAERSTLRRFFRGGAGKMDERWGTKVLGGYADSFLADPSHAYVMWYKGDAQILERYSVMGTGARDPSWRVAIPGTANRVSQDADFIYLAGADLRIGRAQPVSVARLSKRRPKFDLAWPAESVAFYPSYSSIEARGQEVSLCDTQ